MTADNQREDPRESDVHEDQGEAMAILSTLISGMFVYGALGWLADRQLGTSWIMPTGFVVGTVVSVYMVIRRYGSAA